MKLDRKNVRTILLIIAFAVLLYTAAQNLASVYGAVRTVWRVFGVVITGLAMAFVLNVPLKLFENRVFYGMSEDRRPLVRKLRRPVSLVFALVVSLGLIGILIAVVLPQLTATVEPEDASNKNVTWESSNTNVATVNNGEVTAVSAGTATITATAEDGSKTATCTVTVKPAEYTVTVLANGNGSASASPATAEAGTTVTLTAKPDSGWRFSRWEVVEGDVTISGNSFTMPADNVTVRAVFSPIVNLPDTYAIDLIVGEGGEARLSLTNASEGSTITVTATPDDGYELDYITVDGERISGTTFKMPGHDVTVRVYFTDDAALPFTDVSAGAWYFDAVGYVYVGGLMDGVSDTLFDPDGTMTRAMVWAILARVDGETVTGEDWIETAREWAMSEGVSDGENANGYVTREQLATMLYRYAVYKGYDVSIGEDTNILSYADFADLSEYAIPAMQWACGAGVITGVTDATLVPQGEATRAQVAAMLMRFVEAIG